MNIIQAGRKAGKTAALVAEVKNTPNAVMVVTSSAERDELLDRHDLLPGQVVTIAAALRGALRGRPMGPIYIDNLDRVLREVFGGRPVTGGALTSDPAEEPEPERVLGQYAAELTVGQRARGLTWTWRGRITGAEFAPNPRRSLIAYHVKLDSGETIRQLPHELEAEDQ